MLQGLIGKKLDQSQAFLENGKRIPLSLISVSGNVVTQIKSMDTDKYTAVQIGFGDKKRQNRALAGHIKKAGVKTAPRFFHEITMDDTSGIELGSELNIAEMFEAGDVINVTGTSKGKGYAGVVKRHHFKGGPRTHGQSDRERAPGSIGQTTTPGRVYKGKRMSGRMGNETVTVKNLIIVDIKDGVLYVKGLVPGVKGGVVFISKAVDNKLTKAVKKKFIPLFSVKEEVLEEPVIETIEVAALPENPEEVVEEQAEKVEEAQNTEPVEVKSAGVTNTKKMDTIEKISPNTYLLTLKSGEDVNKSIEKLNKIPGVASVVPNITFRAQTGSSIQSEDIQNLPVQFVVKYKNNQAPEQLAENVEQANSSVFGRVSRIAEDVVTGQTGTNSPEKKLERLRSFWSKNRYRYSQYVYRNAPTTGPLANTQVVTFSDAENTEKILEEYRKLPEVESVTPNFMMYTTVTPNDPDFSKLWGMEKIGAPEAWNSGTGSKSITVAVADTGVDYNHPDLSGNVTKGKDFSTCNDTSQESASVPAGSCIHSKQPDNDPMDDSGHGTHVAGTIGAVGNNSIGVAGANWNVNILAIKVLGSGGGGPFSGVLEGIQYAADQGAKVINMSLGAAGAGSCNSIQNRVAQDAVDYARSKGAVVVVAAGNDNHDMSNDIFASCTGVISVGATTQSDTRANFSNYGSAVTISAPGVGIFSTVPSTFNIPSCPVSGQYASCSGTSMATPHVAGAAGLLLSIDPSLSADEVKSILVSTADSITTDRPIGPRLNLANAVGAVSDGNTNPTSAPTQQPTGGASPNPTNPNPTETTPNPTNPNPTSGSTPAPTTPPDGEIIISVRLPGIGTGEFENNDPQKGERTATVSLNDASSQKNATGSLSYENGVYSGTIPAPSGTYQVSVKLDNTLLKRIPGLYRISSTNTPTAQTVLLIPGDLNADGILDIFDYNMMITCVTVGCSNNAADLNDDGVSNPADLNILLRQFANRLGD